MGLNQSIILWIVFWFKWYRLGIGAPSCAMTLTNWFSPKRGWYYGLWSTAHAIGEGLTFIGMAALVDYFSWHAGFIGPQDIADNIITGYRFYKWPETLGLPSVTDWKTKKALYRYLKILKSFTESVKDHKISFIWVLGLASATMYVTRYAINISGCLYLQARGYSLIEAGGLVGLNTFTGIIGCVAYGYISDKYFSARRPPVTLMFGIAEIASLFLIFYGPQSTFVLTIAFIIYGFSLSGLLAVLGGLFAIDIAPKSITGAAMGFVKAFSYIGAAIQEK